MKNVRSAAAALRVPGLVWAALLVAATVFLSANFPDAPWLPGVLVLVAGGLKALGIDWAQVLPGTPDPFAATPQQTIPGANDPITLRPQQTIPAGEQERHEKRRGPVAQLLL